MANLTYRQATQEAPVSTTTKNATLPADAIDSDLFSGDVERINGELVLTLTLPHGPNPSKAAAFPEPITVVADGKVELPQ